MNNDYLIRKLDADCPICEKVHTLELRMRPSQAVVKGENVQYEEMYYSCPLTDEEEREYVSASLMNENLLRARDSYRMRRGLLTSSEIASIRSLYGMSQSDLSALLGWGEVTVTRYESKLIQDETYDVMMRMACENPLFALERLEKNRSRFTDEKYKKIRNNIKRSIEEEGPEYFIRQTMLSLYSKYDQDNEVNGGSQLDIDKVINVIGYFAGFVKNPNTVKLMSLLWYADMLNFSRFGRSMMGLVYVRNEPGALPIGYREIMSLPSVDAEEKLVCGEVGYIITSKREVKISSFTLEELGVLETVSRIFKDSDTKDLLDRLSGEKAFLNSAQDEIIQYSLENRVNL